MVESQEQKMRFYYLPIKVSRNCVKQKKAFDIGLRSCGEEDPLPEEWRGGESPRSKTRFPFWCSTNR